MRTPNSLFRLRSETQITMAAGQNIRELGGYDFEFTSVVPDDFECPVCQLTMKDPIQIGGCGHRFCNICIKSLMRSHSPKCPVDRQPLLRDKIFPDVACHRKILDLEVKCSYVGCPWTGELRAVQKHQLECLFKVVECPNEGCIKKLTRRDMNNHMITECVRREVSCEHCRGSFIVKNKQFPVRCPNNCGVRNIPREKFQRTRTKSLLESHMESHLNLAVCSLETTQNQVKDQSKQIERLTSIFNDKSQQLNDQSQQIDSLTTMQGLVQQVESLTGQAVLVDKTTNQTNDETNKIGATNDKSEEGNTMKQGFKPKSINHIEVGMKVLFSSLGKLRGTVKYVGPVCGLGLVVGIVLDPGEEEPVWLGYRGCNGTYEGKRYFSCAPGRGCFTTFDNVLKCYR